MTVEEFKKTYPAQAHLTGDDLYNAMENAMLRQVSGMEIIQSIQPFYKQYRLRWLFYRTGVGVAFQKEWQADTVCKNCGRGTSSMILWGGVRTCLGCHQRIIGVPNRHFKYLAWKHSRPVMKYAEGLLNALHLLRKKGECRYGVFGDEYKYVYATYNFDSGKTTIVHKPRKWYEYIFIKK